ncbi:MAG: GAF domain-containing protein, partial [Armatimonadetes bacterium]|nr:GAF domain-containing protein [Armatimonadota bacterium]
MSQSEIASLQSRVAALERELTEKRGEIVRLQQGIQASEVTEGQISISEFEETLKRLVQRVAMILQAEKCVIMILDKETGELVGRAPAYGISASDLRMLRVKVRGGVAGEVYRSERPAIITDAVRDPRTVKENVALLHIRNGVTVPLVVERRDEENRVLDRIAIGVLSVYNKRYSEEFNDEDVSLLERLARNAASVISNAQMYRDLVEEKEKLVHTIESLYAGLLLIGSKGNLMQMNARARQIFNVHTDPIGRQYFDVIGHEAACAAAARMLTCSVDNGSLDGSQAAEEI